MHSLRFKDDLNRVQVDGVLLLRFQEAESLNQNLANYQMHEKLFSKRDGVMREKNGARAQLNDYRKRIIMSSNMYVFAQ